MNVSAWSIRNPIPAIMLFFLLSIAGIAGFMGMKIQNFPDIDLPTIIVTATLPGAGPGQLETEVARKIENSIATVQGVKHIYTRLQEGTATITVEFRLEKPVQEALDETRDAVARIRADLPADLRDPAIAKLNIAGLPILTYTVSSSRMDEEALSWFVDDEATRALLAVRGVGGVSRVGGVTREVTVELDPARLMALGATAAEVSRALRQVQRELSGGRLDLGGGEQSVRTLATVRSAETVNGGISIEEGATVGSAETVNGGISIAAKVRLGSAETVNGGISLDIDSEVSGDLETVNGAIRIGPRGVVAGDADTVNGGIRLDGGTVRGVMRTVNGDITLARGSQAGSIEIEEPNRGWWNWGSEKLPRIVIGPEAKVNGPMVFKREVKLYVHATATIGEVRGATAVRYEGEDAPE